MISHSKPCLGDEEVDAAARVIRSGSLAHGPEVEAFEAECAAFVGRKYAIAVSSGSAALHLSLIALGVGPGDRVGMPSYACAALAQAARWQRALPIVSDIGDDYNLRAKPDLTDCHAVILPHLFGKTAVLPNHPSIIEDLAQSLGGETGRATTLAITSFYATKMMATGEGGMALTDDQALAEAIRDRRDYDNRDHFSVRYAYKLTDLQAALGRVQLRRLPEFVARRRALAQQYLQAFAGLPLRTPSPANHVFFRFVVALQQRDALAAHLAARGVDAKRPVYRPLHHYFGGDCPNSERAHRECLSVPLYPALTDAEAAHVIESVRRFFD